MHVISSIVISQVFLTLLLCLLQCLPFRLSPPHSPTSPALKKISSAYLLPYTVRKGLVCVLVNSLVTQGFHVVCQPCKHVVTCMKTIANGHMFTSWVTSVGNCGFAACIRALHSLVCKSLWQLPPNYDRSVCKPYVYSSTQTSQ